MKNSIELKNVSKIYTDGKILTPVLHDVNVVIKQGEMVAIMGPSGSGKSTLMNIIGLLDRPTQGELIIEGEPLSLTMNDNHLAKLRGQKIGFVFQSFNLLPKASALENVLMPTSYQKNKQNIREKAEKLLTDVGLKERMHHKPTELSGGEKQRVAIARALVNDPDIILGDEPTGNLDSKSGQGIIDLLKKLNKNGKTVIIITHDSKIADACDRTIRILDGEVVGGDHV